MNYKITIYGDNLYKEVRFDESMGLISIGTEKNCHVRFSKKSFNEEFRVDIEKMDDRYVAYCSNNASISSSKSSGDKLCNLQLGERIVISFEKTGIEFLSIDFTIDYELAQENYDLGLAIPEGKQVTIGSLSDNDIRIKKDNFKGGTILLNRIGECYKLDLRNYRYGVEVNGYVIREGCVEVFQGDFVGICGIIFYIESDCIYTCTDAEIETTLKRVIKKQHSNHFKYPLFIKNPRQLYVIPDTQVEVLPPQPIPSDGNTNLIASILPMVIMLVVMISVRSMMGSNGMYMIYFGASMGMSVIMSIVTYFTGKKNVRKQKIERIEKYNEYIDRKEVEIQKLQEEEQNICEKMMPSLDNVIQFIERFDARLFERKRGHADYLSIWVGTGRRPAYNQIAFKDQDTIDTGDNLQEYPEEMSKKYKYLDDMPIQLPLATTNAVGVIGTRNKLYQFAKNMMIGIAGQHFEQETKMFFIMSEDDVPLFSWARWIPNMESDEGLRYFIYDEESKKVALQFLYSELSSRELMDDAAGRPNFVVFVYRSEMISGHPVLKYAERANSLGFSFIFFEEQEEMLHYSVEQKVYLDTRENAGVIQSVQDGMKEQRFAYIHEPQSRVAEAALKLAPVYIDEVSLESSLTKHISLYEIMHIMSAYELDLGKRWRESRIWDSIAAPIGVLASGKTMTLDIHEKYHGPHGLVAGTTGSGKSELLQTYIITLATLFHPYELGFVLIDFKGGGMANQFRNLPHLNGAITNIDGKQIDRSLTSIHAELVKRQMLFAQYDVNRIDDYIKLFRDGVAKTPLPHLILIVDEFAELKTDQPEFMKELISTARIGRSLGVHLILATQKPAGVVNDQIWSNSRFRICLKVQEKTDSNEVLKSPLAAEIREPGRAYLQVGNNEIFELFQSGYSGESSTIKNVDEARAFDICKVDLSGKREVVYEQKPEKVEGGETQLEALIQYIGDYCKKENIAKLSPICMPALEEVIPYNAEILDEDGSDILVPLGIYDDPASQKQGTLSLNLSSGNALIIGSSQTGKTNMLQLIIRGIAERYTPEDARIYILDFGTGFLANYSELKHVGGVVKPADDEKLANLFKLIKKDIEERKEILSKLGLSSFSSYREAGYRELPQEIILIDNYSAFRGECPEYVDQLTVLVREGAAMGVVFVLTSSLSSVFGFRLLACFNNRYSFAVNDKTEMGMVFEHCKLMPDNVPGRMVYQKDRLYYEAQTYLTFDAEKEIERKELITKFIEEVNTRYASSTSAAIPEVPEIVSPEIIASMYEEKPGRYQIPFGVSFNTIKPVTFNMIDNISLAIAGKQHSGRRSFINYWMNYMNDNRENAPVDIYILDDYKGTFRNLEKLEVVKVYTSEEEVFDDAIKEIHSRMEENLKNRTRNDRLAFLLLNSADYYQGLSIRRDMLEIYKRLFNKFKNEKIFMTILDCEVLVGVPGICEFLRLVREEKSAMAFENYSEQHVIDQMTALRKKYHKKIEPGEAYLLENNNFYKLKTVFNKTG